MCEGVDAKYPLRRRGHPEDVAKAIVFLASEDSSFIEYSDKKIAAQVKNVVFSYGRGKKAVNALNGITIKVPEGHM